MSSTDLNSLGSQSFPIGGSIPISIRLNPMAKVKLYRVTAVLEQKTNYFASGQHPLSSRLRRTSS